MDVEVCFSWNVLAVRWILERRWSFVGFCIADSMSAFLPLISAVSISRVFESKRHHLRWRPLRQDIINSLLSRPGSSTYCSCYSQYANME